MAELLYSRMQTLAVVSPEQSITLIRTTLSHCRNVGVLRVDETASALMKRLESFGRGCLSLKSGQESRILGIAE